MNSQDNPLQRFKSFWWALGIFSLFGIAALLFHLAQREKFNAESADDQRRSEIRKNTQIEQSKLFPEYKPSDVFPIVGKKLIEQKAQATETKSAEDTKPADAVDAPKN